MQQKKKTCNRKSSNGHEINNSGKHENDRKHRVYLDIFKLKLIYIPDGYSDQCVWDETLPCLSIRTLQLKDTGSIAEVKHC